MFCARVSARVLNGISSVRLLISLVFKRDLKINNLYLFFYSQLTSKHQVLVASFFFSIDRGVSVLFGP